MDGIRLARFSTRIMRYPFVFGGVVDYGWDHPVTDTGDVRLHAVERDAVTGSWVTIRISLVGYHIGLDGLPGRRNFQKAR